jgi:hypothetical protein
MKKLGFLLLFLVIYSANIEAQWTLGGTRKDAPKIQYSYVVIYRNWESVSKSKGDSMWYENEWVTKTQGFEKWHELITWMNSSGNHWSNQLNRKFTRIDEDELIAIYDLTKAEKIRLKFESVQETLPRRVVREEEKWTDNEWILEDEKLCTAKDAIIYYKPPKIYWSSAEKSIQIANKCYYVSFGLREDGIMVWRTFDQNGRNVDPTDDFKKELIKKNPYNKKEKPMK